jgi:general secretion pathway protein D
MAVPLGLSQFSRLYADEAKGDRLPDAPSAAELIRQGRQQFEQQKFEQAERTLGVVKSAALDDKDRDAYLSLLTDVKHAATERRSARQELHNGEDALLGDQTLQAISSFREVVTNRYADQDTIKVAREHLIALNKHAVAAAPAPVAQPAVASGPMTGKQYYELGVSQYRSNDWMHARLSLQMAMNAGYKPASLYQDPPAEILKRMAAREQSDLQRVQHLSQVPASGPADAGTGAATAPAPADAATGAATAPATAEATTAPATSPADATAATPTVPVAPTIPTAPPAAMPAAGPDPLATLRATDDARQLRHQQAISQSQEWVREGQDAQRANNFDRALDLYTRAAQLDPNNAAAVQGRDQVLTLRGQNPAASDMLSDEARRLEAARSEIRYNVQTDLDQAQSSIHQGQWANAQLAIDRARLSSSSDPSIFQPEELRRFTQRIDQTQQDLQRTQEEIVAKQQAGIETGVRKRIEDERRQALRQRQQTIADLIHTSQLLTNQGRYRESLQIIDQILLLDPINDYAVGVKPLLEDKTQFAEQREYTELRDRKVASMLNAAEEKQIPYDDILRYPVDWPTISQTRDQTVAAERGGNTIDRAVQAQLDRQLPELKFDAVGFSDVVDFLRDVSGANLFVNWKSLEAAGIDRNTPVNTTLRNIKFSKALSTILDSVGGGQTKLGYTVDEGVITISTLDDLSKNVAVRVYDIRDLIINVPDFNDAPQFSLDASQNQGNSGGGGGGSGTGGATQGGVSNTLFAGSGANGIKETGPTRQELVDSITKLIEDTVATDTWKDNGGSVGALRELEGQLIVTQTPENHRQLVNLLEQLRETRAIQVTIEARFLTVQRNYLQDVGVDLNFLFNLNSAWSKNFGTIPITTPSSTFNMNPTTGVQGSIGAGTSTPTGLTTSATYLDDFQVQLTLRAVEASVNSTLVTAPRITLFNGQRAFVLISTQRAYVSNLTPIVSTGVSSFAPTVSIVQSGVLLDVQATVSADRKYVTLTLRPQLATLLDLAPFTFQSGASNPAGGGIGANGFGFIGGVAPSGTIQEPELQITEVKTTVSVPDGGTLLLGGQTVAGETEREIGVPVLSKIPFLKRLFTNRSMAKDEQILLILVRPTIILQREIEQKQFPLLTSKLTGG